MGSEITSTPASKAKPRWDCFRSLHEDNKEEDLLGIRGDNGDSGRRSCLKTGVFSRFLHKIALAMNADDLRREQKE
jgi:hypothetical protein